MTLPDLDTPAFVIDGGALFERTATLARAVDGCRFAYSVKTLPVPEAVLLASEAGWLVEVVSKDECAFVQNLGVSLGEVIINGPSKDDELLRLGLGSGAIVHVDSDEELSRARAIRAVLPSGRLGVRLGLGVTDPMWGRFGLDASDINGAIRRLADSSDPNGPITGFHVHSGTNRASCQEFAAVSARALAFAASYSRYAGVDVEWIDLGGGFADAFVAPLASSLWSPPEVEVFARHARSLLDDWDGRPPVLIFEPGRALVGPCVDLYTRVESVKTIAGVQLATVDVGVNSLPFARSFAYPIELCGSRDDRRAETVVCGPLCMMEDIISHGTPLPMLATGDVLRIRGVGAYNVSMSYDFIRPRATVNILHGHRLSRTRTMFS